MAWRRQRTSRGASGGEFSQVLVALELKIASGMFVAIWPLLQSAQPTTFPPSDQFDLVMTDWIMLYLARPLGGQKRRFVATDSSCHGEDS
jgi:hypothetical protein